MNQTALRAISIHLAVCVAAVGLACGAATHRRPADALPDACAPRALASSGPDVSAPPHARTLAALGGDPADLDATQWRELAQGFWPRWRVYRFADPVHPTRAVAAALGPGGRVVDLTNKHPLARENEALACFNALSRSEGVRVGRGNAAPYLAFFLWTQLPDVEQFLRGEEDARAALAHPWQSRHDEWLLAQLETTTEPPLPVRQAGRSFAATAWDWHWSRGVVYRYDLSTTANGQVRFRQSPAGSQRPREGPTSTASCFAVDPDGLVLTAAHAVEGAHAITLRFATGDERAATVERRAPDADLALLRVERGLPAYLPLATRDPEGGEAVFTLAFPGPRLLWTEPDYASGSVRGAGPAPSLVETDLPAHAGSSGAPLVDVRGEVVGVLSRIEETSEKRWRATLAVRAGEARALLERAPEPPAPALSRSEAKQRVLAAVCEVEAELVDDAEPSAPAR
jgi:hypothetical protein